MNSAKISEGFRFLRVLTPGRAFNYWLLQASAILSRLTVSPVLIGSPAFIHIEPTNLCNLQCPECPTGAGLLTRPKGNISLVDYQNILDKVSPKGCYLTLYFQGEPYLHKDFIEMVHRAKQQRLFVVTSTNAQLISEEVAEQTVQSGLDRIILSFDGPDAATYGTYRKGGEWQKVVAAVGYLKKAKEKFHTSAPLIVLQCLLLKANEGRQQEVRQLAKTLGADVIEFKTLQLLDCKKSSDLLPVNGKRSRYFWKDGQGYVMKKRRNSACSRIFNSCVITWNGEVAPCCYDKNADFSYGNIHSQSLHEIWMGSSRRSFVSKVINARKDTGICNNCDE